MEVLAVEATGGVRAVPDRERRLRVFLKVPLDAFSLDAMISDLDVIPVLHLDDLDP